MTRAIEPVDDSANAPAAPVRRWRRVIRLARRRVAMLLDLVFPPHCGACDAALDEPQPAPVPGLCATCAEALTLLEDNVCARCATPLGPFAHEAAGPKGDRCLNCRNLRVAFSRTWAACRYDGPVQQLVARLKYARRPALCRTLEFLLCRRLALGFGLRRELPPLALGDDVLAVAEEVQDYYGRLLPDVPTSTADAMPDLVMPVPLSAWRQWRRGFNQGLLLARAVSRHFNLPLVRDNLVRVRHTAEQAGKGRAERLQSMIGAFALRRPDEVAGKTVLLVDDVMTTGSTANACARALRGLDGQGEKTGAARVWVAVVARA
jgi:ComF family protein